MAIEAIGYLAAFLTCIAYLWQVSSQLKPGDFRNISLPSKACMFIAASLWVIYGIATDNQSIVVVGSVFASITLPILFLKIKEDMKQQENKKKFAITPSRYESLRKNR